MSSINPLIPVDSDSDNETDVTGKTERKLKEIEVKKLMLKQAEEISVYESELKKMDSEKRIREIKYKTRLAELEMQAFDVSIASKSRCGSHFSFKDGRLPPSLSAAEKMRNTDMWTAGLQQEIIPKNPFVENYSKNPFYVPENSNPFYVPENSNPCYVPEYSNPFLDSPVRKIEENNPQAVMMKLTLLHAMRPVRFNGDPADYPVFRERIRTHLEDGLLPESQMVEFLNKFVEGEVADVLKRVSGCPYDQIISVLYDRYGHPAKVAAACLKNITSFQKIGPSDHKELLNFSEILESASSRLTGEYELEASSTSNIQLIMSRLPGYLINKWGETSFNLRRKNIIPKIRHICDFVKKQALIKNDPLFSVNTETKHFEKKFEKPTVSKQQYDYKYRHDSKDKQSSSYMTYTDKNSSKCAYCSFNNHVLPDCKKFQSLDTQSRWNFVKNEQLCHACLSPGHYKTSCSFENVCTCTNDHNIKHHPLLHNDKGTRERYNKINEKPKFEKKSDNFATFVNPLNKIVLLHVSTVALIAPCGKRITTYGLIDNGSRGSIISRSVAEHLNVKGRKESLSINTILGCETHNCEIINLNIQSVNGHSKLYDVEAIISDNFNISEEVLPHDLNLQGYAHLADIILPEVDIKKISILIGKDVDEIHDIYEFRKSPWQNIPVHGILGPLGWVITGTLNGNQPYHNVSNKINIACNYIDYDQNLNDMVEKFWKIEDSGANKTMSNEKSLSVDDKRAIDIIKETTVISDGHYETGLLWKNDNIQFPNNKLQAEHRLSSLKRKFKRDLNYKDRYIENMNESISKGYARKLNSSEVLSVTDRTWYLPHFGVINPKKPEKLRIVFDAAAKYKGISLNDNLLTGPDTTNNLVGVILRFRQENIALSADIQSMFHQIKVSKSDQDSLRFLWWDSDIDFEPSEYVFCRHIFGATDSPCIATSALRKTALDNMHVFDELTIKTIENNFYVDDLLTSVPTVDMAIKLGHNLSNVCEKGGFNLTQFNSNSKKVLSTFPADKLAEKTINLDFDQLAETKALGIKWNVENDYLEFDVVDLHKPNTMRGVLSTICSIFDPLNILAPIIVPAKLIMQELWRKKWTWDKPLEGPLLHKWIDWKQNLHIIENIKIPRCYFGKFEHSNCTIQLHHFSDSSELMYGTVSFLRIQYNNGEIECRFIIGKSRNAPLKAVSIPRLELQAAVLATRMNTFITNELDFKFESITFWTDSMIVLNYINNTNRRFKTFVANRITEIHECTTPDQWKHCPSAINSADDISRGITPHKLQSWLSGPEFLKRPLSEWKHSQIENVNLDFLEVKKEINFIETANSESKLMCLINKYSNWTKCLRAFGWLIKFINWLKLKKDDKLKINKTLNLCDLQIAKRKVIALVQLDCFEKEITALRKGNSVKNSSSIISLKPVLIDNVICVGGRLSKAPISQSAMHPMIIPKEHNVTNMIIRFTHETSGHCPREEVLSIIREEFWIVKSRVAINKVLNSCIKCKRMLAPAINQQMSELPISRLTPFEPCFSYSGADLFGPILVKRGRGRTIVKRWGVLFTCMNSRAVHLEVAHSLETDDFMLTLIRFLNRRGHVRELRTDNGSNFVGADKELKHLIQNMDQNKIEKNLGERGVKWIFHTPLAPHMSGVWESLVKVVKRSLKTILKEPVYDEVLQTVFTEAEYIANNRPLTKNPLSPYDCEPLTPNHFLNIRPSLNIPPGIISETDKFHSKRWRQAQLLTEHYWKRWLKEYLPSLQKRQKWHTIKHNLCTGDLVLLVDEYIPRNKWLIGRIKSVFKGSDDLVRSVEIKTKNGIFKRPVTKLCLLEAHNTDI